MAARANLFLEVSLPPEAPPPRDALTRLVALRAEASETAHLANLLGRSLPAAIALPVLAAATIIAAAPGLAPALAWAALIGLATAAMILSYVRTERQPFERATLKVFAGDLDAALLFAGVAFGAGAFLAIPALSSGGIALAFALVPSIMVAAMLRETQPALFFLAPMGALSSLACVLRPFADGLLAAVLVVAACTVLGGALHLLRHRADDALPAGLNATQ